MADTAGSTKLTPEQTQWFEAHYFDKHGRGIRYLYVADGSGGPFNRKQRRKLKKLGYA